MNGPKTVSLDASVRPLFVGVDVGGTGIKIGIVDDLGQILIQDRIATEQEKGPKNAMVRVAALISDLQQRLGIESSDIARVGLATPGTMDTGRGMLLQPHNLPEWWNCPIRDMLVDACGKEVTFGNDANTAAFGEFWVGSGSEFHSVAFFTLGTGVGGGVIIGDMTIEGEHSAGSELGHAIIDYTDDARMCGCGQVGHLEAYASARAVVKRTEESLADGGKSSLTERIAQGEELSPLMLSQEAEKGDELSYEIIMETAKYLGIGAVNVMHTIDPGAVIFGGAMTFGGANSRLGQQFLDRIRREIHARAFPALIEQTVIEFASLGGDAGFIGAAGIARNEYDKAEVQRSVD